MTNKYPIIILGVCVIGLAVWGYLTSQELKKYHQQQINELREQSRAANDSAMYYLNNIQMEIDGMRFEYDSVSKVFLSTQTKQQQQIRNINKKYENIYQRIDTISLDSLLYLLSTELSEVQG